MTGGRESGKCQIGPKTVRFTRRLLRLAGLIQGIFGYHRDLERPLLSQQATNATFDINPIDYFLTVI
jgi:hypothetical protein